MSEIFVVSKISAVRIKLLAAHVVQQALGKDVPPEKAAKLLGDAKLEPADVKAVVAALHYILCSAARYDVPDDTLAFELQQLGLPKEHTEALTNALREGRAALQQHFVASSLRLPRLASMAWQARPPASPPPCAAATRRRPPAAGPSPTPGAGARGWEPGESSRGGADPWRERAEARGGAGTRCRAL